MSLIMADHAWVPVLVVFVAAGIGAVTDVWKFRVYNTLTIPLLLSGLAYHIMFTGWHGITSSALGVLFGFGVLVVPYALGLMGAGDVKLMAGVGAWLGLYPTVVVFVASSLVAGIYATGLIVYRGKLSESAVTLKVIFYRFAALGMHFGKDDLVEELSTGADRRLRVIPFGAMIPLGMLCAAVWFNWLTLA